jgi:SET domain-containing protein
MTTKEELLHELTNNSYVTLKPSPIAGIGVFAIRDIPKGTRSMFSKPDVNDRWITIPMHEVKQLPEHAQKLIGNFCLFDEENYFVPDHGFKKIDMSLFLNHADNPNIVSVNEGSYFEAIRDILTDEELVIDYGTIVDDSE